MRVLILAAGRGTRISRYLSGNPKCTVDIGGKKLIEYTIELLKSRGIHDIGIVLGYRHEVIENILKDQNIKFYYNPFFDVTNSIASAWFAKGFFEDNDDLMIMNGDVFLEEQAIYVEDVAARFWAEVDYIEDYERIQKFVAAHGLLKGNSND